MRVAIPKVVSHPVMIMDTILRVAVPMVPMKAGAAILMKEATRAAEVHKARTTKAAINTPMEMITATIAAILIILTAKIVACLAGINMVIVIMNVKVAVRITTVGPAAIILAAMINTTMITMIIVAMQVAIMTRERPVAASGTITRVGNTMETGVAAVTNKRRMTATKTNTTNMVRTKAMRINMMKAAVKTSLITMKILIPVGAAVHPVNPVPVKTWATTITN